MQIIERGWNYSILDPTVTTFQVPSNLEGGVIAHATLATAVATSIFTAGQGSPAGEGLAFNQDGTTRFRTCVLGLIQITSAGGASDANFTNTIPLNIYDIRSTGTLKQSFLITANNPNKRFGSNIARLGGIGFAFAAAGTGGTNPRVYVEWRFAD